MMFSWEFPPQGAGLAPGCLLFLTTAAPLRRVPRLVVAARRTHADGLQDVGVSNAPCGSSSTRPDGAARRRPAQNRDRAPKTEKDFTVARRVITAILGARRRPRSSWRERNALLAQASQPVHDVERPASSGAWPPLPQDGRRLRGVVTGRPLDFGARGRDHRPPLPAGRLDALDARPPPGTEGVVPLSSPRRAVDRLLRERAVEEGEHRGRPAGHDLRRMHRPPRRHLVTSGDIVLSPNYRARCTASVPGRKLECLTELTVPPASVRTVAPLRAGRRWFCSLCSTMATTTRWRHRPVNLPPVSGASWFGVGRSRCTADRGTCCSPGAARSSPRFRCESARGDGQAQPVVDNVLRSPVTRRSTTAVRRSPSATPGSSPIGSDIPPTPGSPWSWSTDREA